MCGYSDSEEKAIATWNTRAVLVNPVLTLDELREMAGEHVWVSGEESYAIVMIDKGEPQANPVYVRGVRSRETGIGFGYKLDVDLWGLKCYRHKPEREDGR
jgi:hypothetical protein